MNLRRACAGWLALFGLTGCRPDPALPPPVDGFELERYLGRWHEIARLPNRFERGLEAITAVYSLREDGSVAVLNRGWSLKKDRWKEARGRARFLGDPAVAALEVSFFGPFFAGYRVVALDGDYRWALVGSDRMDLLWLLAREPVLPGALEDSLVALAAGLGYDTDALVRVDPSRLPAEPTEEARP